MDFLGKILWSATRQCRAWWPLEVSEGKTALFAAKLAHNHKTSWVMIKTDCQSLVYMLSRELSCLVSM